MGITKETRLEAYIQRPVTRVNQIMQVLGDREMTSREIAYELGFTDLNAVKPRLTELKDIGMISPVRKQLDLTTKRNVAVWRKV